MDKNEIYYGLFLSRRQIDFLHNYSQGFMRIKCFATFLNLAVMEPTHYVKDDYQVDLTPGQFAISEVELSKLWKCNRKTAAKMVNMLHEVGLVTSLSNPRTTIFTVPCIASWYINDRQIYNKAYTRHPVIKPREKANRRKTAVISSTSDVTAAVQTADVTLVQE